jgi:methyltransferase (TIGR00027 family)
MSERNASGTALGTLYMRAVHQLLDARPLILEDLPALNLLGEEKVNEIKKNHKHHRTPAASSLRAHIVLRSRFTEDCLSEAVNRGVSQYIILGAGFDTFAFRQPTWASKLRIVEIDQPATQAQKLSCLRNTGISIPSNLQFANIDFERESLLDGFKRQGISLTEPSFFSWLGVTMYLQEEAIDAVLKSVACFPVESEIVFTFSQPPEALSEKENKFHVSLSQIVSSSGEPFISFFTPAAIENKLRDIGFKSMGILSSEEAEKRYFSNRPRDLRIYKRSAIAYAIT